MIATLTLGQALFRPGLGAMWALALLTASFANGAYSFVVSLEARCDGQDMDGRLYSIFVRIQDLAGNHGAAIAKVVVPHDQGASHHSIISISVCGASGTGGQGSCPMGSFNTQQIVLAPNGKSINNFGGLGGISDEHQSVFSPGTLQANSDYLFFVATRTSLNSDTGMVVLSGGSGPLGGQWTLDFQRPQPGSYDYYQSVPGFGQIFGSCPKSVIALEPFRYSEFRTRRSAACFGSSNRR